MTSMKAVTFANFGAPSVLQATVVERPEPGPDDVLVRIHAAGVCYHDVLSRGGKIPGGEPNRVLGHEIAGEIVETGTNVPAERNGERVVVYQRLYCGQCRYCLSGRQDLCRNSRVLDDLDMKSAALAVCPVGTSVRAALGVAQVEPGQTVLITGAGGGLGLHQIQVVKSVNAHVIAVTSSQEKAEIISQAGADEVIISPDLKFSGEVWRRTGKQGVDIVLENVVSSTFGESLRSTAQNAIVVVLGNISAKRVEIDPGLIIARRIRIAGSGNATYKDVRIALHLLATDAVRPFIGAVLPFPRVSEGHAMMEEREVVGRVVLSGW
jgi:acryloyl-coenzyme A reductase